MALVQVSTSPRGGLLAIGMLVAAGAFVHRLAFTATVVSALIYLSYGLCRIVGMALDGSNVDYWTQ